MADFADFLLRIAPLIAGTSAEAMGILDRLSEQQVAAATQDDPLLDLIDEWLEDDSQHVNIDREIVLSKLGTEIELLAAGRVPWEQSNPYSFGQYVRARKGTLTRLYGMTDRRGHAGTSVVSFHHRRNGDLGDLGERPSGHFSMDQGDFERTGGLK